MRALAAFILGIGAWITNAFRQTWQWAKTRAAELVGAISNWDAHVTWSLRRFGRDTRANIAGIGLGIVFAIVGIVVVMFLLSALAPTFFDGLGSFIENLTTVELGDSDAANLAETIIQVLALLVAVAGAAVLVIFALRAFGVGGKR